MALFSECTPQCARKVLDTADIVRDAMLRQMTTCSGTLLKRPKGERAGHGHLNMKVFIQNEAGSCVKHSHDEKTLELKGTSQVSRAYPLPYGFVLDTTAADGLNVDCFVLTKRSLHMGEIVDCEPVGLMEQIEDCEADHNVLAVIRGEEGHVDSITRRILTDFVGHVFDHIAGKTIAVGSFGGPKVAFRYLAQCQDQQ